MNARRLRHPLLTLARFLICAGLLAYVISRIDRDSVGRILQASLGNWDLLLAGLAFTFLGLCAGAWRWGMILRSQGFRIGAGRTFVIFFIGQFFNAFMLGACGGDVARAYLVARGLRDKRTEAATTVFIDRGIGLLTMILFCCVMIAFRLPLFLDHHGTRGPGVLMVVFWFGSVAAIYGLFHRNRFEHWRLFQYVETRTAAGPFIRRAYDAFYLFRKDARVLLASVALSMLNLALLTLACACFGRGLEIRAVPADYFTLFPIISVLAAIPLTPGSLGVRESLFITLFGAVDVPAPQAVLLSLLGYAAGTAWSLFGGLLLLVRSAAGAANIPAEIRAEHLATIPPAPAGANDRPRKPLRCD